MPYPSPADVNVTRGLGEILTYVNDITQNWFSNMFLISIYVIILIGFYKAKDDFKGAFAVAGFGTFVVALLFWIGGFVTPFALVVTIGLTIVGTLLLLLDNN